MVCFDNLYADRPIGIYTEIQGGNFFEPKMLLEIVPVCPFSNKSSRELLNVDFAQVSPMFQESLGVSGPVRGIIEIHH